MMKIIASAILLLASRCAFGAYHFDDGIYLRAAGSPAPEIVCQNGREMFLGEKQTLDILKCELIPHDNANTAFHLAVTVPFDESIKGDSFILWVDGTAYRQHMLGTDKNESSLGFTIEGGNEAKEVSEFFNIPLPLRSHPGYRLLTTFTPAKTEFEPGEDVTVLLRIRNVGSDPVAFRKGGRNRAARDNQYVFTAYFQGKQVEDIGTSSHFGGMSYKEVIAPGDAFEETISLSKWFAFDQPGWYELHGSYYLKFMETDPLSWKTLWEDSVSADFSVHIKHDKHPEPAAPGNPPPDIGSPNP